MSCAENMELNTREIEDGKVVLESTPLSFNLATTSRCNMNPPCVMCLRNKGEENLDLPMRILMKCGYAIDEAALLVLHGVGEPLIYKNLFDLAEMAPDAKKIFTTNGILMGSYINKIVTNIAKVSISIDAAKAKTYKDIRHQDFDSLIGSIRRLVKAKETTSSIYPIIDINFCIMRHNMAEMAAFVKLGDMLGVDTVHFFHLNEGPEYDWKVSWFDYYKEHARIEPEKHDNYVLDMISEAKRRGVKVIFDGKKFFTGMVSDFRFADDPPAVQFPDIRRKLICDLPWRQLQINPLGTVSNCCYQWDVGDLRYNSFNEIWNGEVQVAVRRAILSGTLNEHCTHVKCPVTGRI